MGLVMVVVVGVPETERSQSGRACVQEVSADFPIDCAEYECAMRECVGKEAWGSCCVSGSGA